MERDIDPIETQEWLDALASVVRHEGADRAQYLLKQLSNEVSNTSTSDVPFAINTPFRNTIPVTEQVKYPGDLEMERKIQGYINWNAVAMVVRANKSGDDLGGHMSSFQSSALLYDIGFNHFWRAPSEEHGGDLIYYQGHISPGIYARSFVEGRLSEDQIDNFRREVDGKGISSYPHPWLMPEYWQFPTVSMGLGPIQAIYQAHVLRYLEHREQVKPGRQIWAFLGDGECDEPESLGAISLAAREKLDNLNFVINCNLQRLDGPVRGNGKIIQELEGVFRGAGWNVIKVVWGSGWDKLFARDKSGLLQKRMDEVVDGELQAYKAHGGAYTREHFFGRYPETAELVKDMTDDEIYHLARGAHDPYKVYNAYKQAFERTGQPTVILAHSVKGYGVAAGEAQNATHQLKKLDVDSLKAFRDRCNVPISDKDLEDGKIPFYRPDENTAELQYMKKRRLTLGGYLPARRTNADEIPKVPALDAFSGLLKDTGKREISTTMALVRIMSTLAKDKDIGDRIVPIVPDEARTFGMEGMFRQVGIYAPEGQKYEPQDKGQVMWYKEDQGGQILQEGINEAGAFSSWIAAATSYSTNNHVLVPFYIYYSMFGFQRIGDLAWAAGDSQARGFLIGGTSGRTTLNGEGLQHQDGHSHILAGTIPNCVTYDATYSYEVAVIVQDGLRRMVQEQESVYYYITTLNENYHHPEMPKGAEEGIKRGMYLLEDNVGKAKKGVQLLGSGSILNEVRAAAKILKDDFGVSADVWAVTSYNELTRDGLNVDRNNLLHPEKEPQEAFVTRQLKGRTGPVVASSDYIKNYANQIRGWVPASYHVLGTDGFGRSDSRQKLRHFFEVDRYWVTVTALKALADEGVIKPSEVTKAFKKFDLDPGKPNPVTV
ncbi:pyruvate dehydrogenase (acetyl-transferring), homodimeric type [Natronospirillum operosum]|uniref:Pyruvate dehydrogenase E1 component n=1 Tax=Natronospirillum operosum TaxID=2759953 RepID=A0A4Z0WIS0_9GAMM|nr:pyruvate dehydrogenase (acetyl-transferring), homodimeric type [Natronospirillum operosum]TGG95343.1 pyruvate dehydrogenase (acetyl-transferring), homodimeric type [Natronospirillum operosum]